MTSAIIVLSGMTLIAGLALAASARAGNRKQTALADAINNALPQTQCTQCGYSGCQPYANAIVGGQADINQCPPGGAVVLQELAQLMGREIKPLDESHGIEKPREIAVIDEAVCIGCKKCIQVCPVDAILGAAKLMHTVIESECTGCDLCPPACPVDCIDMLPALTGIHAWQIARPAREPLARH